MESYQAYLISHIKQSHRVALHLDNSDAWLQIDRILTEQQAVIVPIPHFFSHKQIQHMIDVAGIDRVICAKGAEQLWQSYGFSTVTGFSGLFILMARKIDNYPPLPAQTHKITFTSGTTNEPKGVCLSLQHLQAVGQSLAQVTTQFKVKKHLCVLPLSVLLENVAATHAAQKANISVMTPSLAEIGLSGSSGLDIMKLIDGIMHYRPDSLILMPQMLKAIITVIESQGHIDLSFLKFIAVGGAVCSKGLLLKARQLNLPVYEGYGISECGSVISLNTDSNKLGSVGKILPHQQVKINDDGEILTKGNLFIGYLGDDSYNSRADNEWYATGDLGRFDKDNNLHIIGRKKNVIINSFGRNISPDWIEAELLSISEIQQAVVYGESQPYLTAICVSPSSQEQLYKKIESLNQSLPDYAQVKQLLVSKTAFTVENNMLTASGKAKHQNIFNHFNHVLTEIYANK
jgi:long-subunit acyl-CoA synthetase (AMP-forming)